MRLVLGVAVQLWLGAWFLVSVASQFSDRVCERLPRMSALGLVPLWTFFAPRPGMHDTHLLYRDRSSDGSVGTTSYVPIIESRRWYHVVWNPRKIRTKVLVDSVDSLLRLAARTYGDRQNPRWLVLSASYLMLLNVVMRMPHDASAQSRQFVLVRDKSFGPDPDRTILFLSEFHSFAERRAARRGN